MVEQDGIGTLDPESGVSPQDFRFAPETFPHQVEQKEEHEVINITEAEFYRQHHQAIADRRNRGLRRLSRRVTAEDVAAEFEQLRQADLERRNHPEYQEWQKMLQVVLEHFKAKRDDPEGEGKNYRILIFALGGGMRGPYGAGDVAGLNEVGLTADKADILAGISAGAANLIYYAGGKLHTLRGAAIYYYQCATKAFLNVLGRPQHMMDSRVVIDVMRQGPQAVDQETVRKGPEFYAGITPKDDPHAPVEFADIKKSKPDLITPVGASMNVPILFAPGIKVNTGGLTIEYIDGAFGELPLEELTERFGPTDILVLPNIPFQRVEDFKPTGSWVERLPRSGSVGTIRKFLQVAGELRKSLEFFEKEKGVNIGMMWPPNRGLETLNNDPDVVQLGIYDTIKDTIEQCGEKIPDYIEMYLPKENKYLRIARGK